MELLCPLCGKVLQKAERSLRCENRHSFDIARQGYVNLLPVQNKRSLHPGDTKEQVQSRREFLDGGFYAPICQALCRMAEGMTGPISDVGCGEGYYSSRLAERLGAELVGLDISKEAVRYAAGRYKDATWLCASAAHLPVEDNAVGLLTSLFALTLPEEFLRVLRPGGAFIQAEKHYLSHPYGKAQRQCPGPAGLYLGEKRVCAVFLYGGRMSGAKPAFHDASCVPHLQRGRRGLGGHRNADRHCQLRDQSLPPGKIIMPRSHDRGFRFTICAKVGTIVKMP